MWEARMQHIIKEVSALPGIEAELYYRKVGNEVPHVALRWDEKKLGLTKQQVVEALRRGEPQIEVVGGQLREMVRHDEPLPPTVSQAAGEPARLISIVSSTLRPGEEKIIARRLKEIFKRA